MKKFTLIISLGLLLLPGCTNVGTAQQEATEAIQNISNEAVRIKTNIETTTAQVKGAIDAVNGALTATQDAIGSVQDIGNEFADLDLDETENDPSLSSED